MVGISQRLERLKALLIQREELRLEIDWLLLVTVVFETDMTERANPSEAHHVSLVLWESPRASTAF